MNAEKLVMVEMLKDLTPYNQGEIQCVSESWAAILDKTGFAKVRRDLHPPNVEALKAEQAKEHLRERQEFMGSNGGMGAAIQAQTAAISELAKSIAAGRR